MAVQNNYTELKQLSNGIWVFPDNTVNWGGEMNYNLEVLNSVCAKKTINFYFGDDLISSYTSDNNTFDVCYPKPSSLTFKLDGEVLGVYNATNDVEINIPKAKTLSFVDSEGKKLAVYNTKEETSVTIPTYHSATETDIYDMFSTPNAQFEFVEG